MQLAPDALVGGAKHASHASDGRHAGQERSGSMKPKSTRRSPRKRRTVERYAFGAATTNEPMNDAQRLTEPTEGRDWDAAAAEEPVDVPRGRGNLDGEMLTTDQRPARTHDDFGDVERGREAVARSSEEHLTDETEDRE
jgi:hypothetical protein